MNDLFRNTFIQALGVAALIYISFQLLDWGIEVILRILRSFDNWYRIYGSKWAEEVAITFGVLYLLFAAVINSRSR
ncbi:hypothetical protein [Coleofasciculus sp. G2-EDA-02]|uniref:hypothetical protein n=1 Tax=Coleofasciculus sp. G2-EDA-02 TaxID=3069529 RepID=UPI0032FB31C3